MYTDFVKDAINLAQKNGEIKGKIEMYDKLSPIVQSHHDMTAALTKHNEEERAHLDNLFVDYEAAMVKRKTAALAFIEGKSDETLKLYLANQPVAYNLWKDATHDELIKLVFDVYDEVIPDPIDDFDDTDSMI
jgi:hypothetical protein